MKVGFFGLLQLMLIGLKLGNLIDWSWWLVLSPMYVGVVASICVVAFIGWALKQ